MISRYPFIMNLDTLQWIFTETEWQRNCIFYLART